MQPTPSRGMFVSRFQRKAVRIVSDFGSSLRSSPSLTIHHIPLLAPPLSRQPLQPNGHIPHLDPAGNPIVSDHPSGSFSLGPAHMDEQSQQMMMQTHNQLSQPGGRDYKMAAQRQLGIAPQYITPQHTSAAQLPRTSPANMGQQNETSDPTPQLQQMQPQYYIDPQGRPVVHPYLQQIRPPHPQAIQPQHPQFQSLTPGQQQQIMQQYSMHHPAYLQQIQHHHQQVQLQMQQNLGARAVQTPPQRLPANLMDGSPAAARLRPPNQPRTASQAISQNTSPTFNSEMAQPVVLQGKEKGSMALAPPAIGMRSSGASTLKAQSLPPSNPASEDQEPKAFQAVGKTIGREESGVNGDDLGSKAMEEAQIAAPVTSRLAHSSLVVRTRRKEEKVQRLKRQIKQTKAELQTALQETSEVQALLEKPTSDAQSRQKFDQYVLEL